MGSLLVLKKASAMANLVSYLGKADDCGTNLYFVWCSSGLLGLAFQQDGNTVADGVKPAATDALQLVRSSQLQRRLANRAGEDIEQVLADHIFHILQPFRSHPHFMVRRGAPQFTFRCPALALFLVQHADLALESAAD